MSGAPAPDIHAAVLNLLATVKYAKDDEDEARFAACWSQDAQLQITSNGQSMPPMDGRETIMTFYRRVWETGGHGKDNTREVHVAEHPDIVALETGHLRVRHATSFFFADDGEPRLRGYGSFEDEIIFENGVWCIARRRATLIRSA